MTKTGFAEPKKHIILIDDEYNETHPCSLDLNYVTQSVSDDLFSCNWFNSAQLIRQQNHITCRADRRTKSGGDRAQVTLPDMGYLFRWEIGVPSG